MDSHSDDEDVDPPIEEEDEDVEPPEEEEEGVPDDAIAPAHSPAHSAHSDEPDSPPFSPILYVPGPPVEIDSPPLSPGSDLPSMISLEAAEYGDLGRVWERLQIQRVKIIALIERLGDESAAIIDELRDDMGVVLGRTRALKDNQMDLREQMDNLQRGFLTARDSDRKLWRRTTDL